MKKYNTKIMRIGASRYILIPYEIFNDSAFPFTEKSNLTVKVVGDTFFVKRKGTFKKLKASQKKNVSRRVS